MDIGYFLKLMLDRGASDMFLSTGTPVHIKIEGRLAALGTSPLPAGMVKKIAYSLMDEGAVPKFERELEYNMALAVKDVGRFRARLVNQDALGIHIAFIEPGAAELAALDAKLIAVAAEDEPFMALASEVAGAAAAALEQAVRAREISTEDLFDVDYQPIPGTEPQQVMAKHTVLVERLFPPLIEPPLGRDARIVFCCVTDRKGHIAAHNKKYSHPQRPGDVVWNTANARNRRIFADRAGTLAGRATCRCRTRRCRLSRCTSAAKATGLSNTATRPNAPSPQGSIDLAVCSPSAPCASQSAMPPCAASSAVCGE